MMLPLSHGHAVMMSKVEAVLNFGTAPLKRFANEAEKMNKMVDATNGRRARSLVVLETGTVIKSSVDAETLKGRIASIFK